MFPLQFGTGLPTWGFFAISLVFSFIINTQINLLTGITTFFLFNNDGLIRAKRVVIDLFSGLLLPIRFFPGWAQHVMKFLPFQSISYVPSMIFTSGFTTSETINAIILQGVWTLVLLVPIQVLWVIAKKQMTIQGG